MKSLLLKNAHIVDGTAAERSDRVIVVSENGVVRDVGKTVTSAGADVIDVAGRHKSAQKALTQSRSAASICRPTFISTRCLASAVSPASPILR